MRARRVPTQRTRARSWPRVVLRAGVLGQSGQGVGRQSATRAPLLLCVRSFVKITYVNGVWNFRQ